MQNVHKSSDIMTRKVLRRVSQLLVKSEDFRSSLTTVFTKLISDVTRRTTKQQTHKKTTMRSVVCVLALLAYVYAQAYNSLIVAKDYSTGNTLGYLRPDPSHPGFYQFDTTDQSSHLVVTVTEGVPQSDFATVANSRGFPYFGFIQFNGDLSTSSSSYVFPTGVNQSPQGATPSSVGSDYGNPSESAVWYVDPTTKGNNFSRI